MAAFYLDTSALAKRYIGETGTGWITALTEASAGHSLRTVRLTGVELVAAMVRRARGGQLRVSQVRQGLASFRLDWEDRFEIVEANDLLVSRAMDIAEMHGLRGYDAVHVAAAVQLQQARQEQALPALTFVSADIEQLRAAAIEGLRVEDPNHHP